MAKQLTMDFGFPEPEDDAPVPKPAAPIPVTEVVPEEKIPDAGIKSEVIFVHEPAPEYQHSLEQQVNKRGRPSLKKITVTADIISVPDDEVLFQKQYYPIGEVAAMFHESVSLIRFWEKEFPVLQPKKNRKGNRLFRPEDIKNLQLIYDLLRRRMFTIEGAKSYINQANKANHFESVQTLEKIKKFLIELKSQL